MATKVSDSPDEFLQRAFEYDWNISIAQQTSELWIKEEFLKILTQLDSGLKGILRISNDTIDHYIQNIKLNVPDEFHSLLHDKIWNLLFIKYGDFIINKQDFELHLLKLFSPGNISAGIVTSTQIHLNSNFIKLLHPELKKYFDRQEHDLLRTVLEGTKPEWKLKFNFKCGAFVDLFKRIKSAKSLTATNGDLNKWICSNFQFKKGSSYADFKPSTVKDILNGKKPYKGPALAEDLFAK